MKQPPAVLRYFQSHTLPIMLRHPPDRWWHACQELPEEVKAEVLPWLRQQKHRMDCWARKRGPVETKKPRR